MTGAGELKIAVIPGDSTGMEVTAEALKMLKATIGEFDTTEYDLSSRRHLRNGELLTGADLDSLHEHDTILLGVIDDPANIPLGILERNLPLKMCFALNHHVSLRSSKPFPGVESPLKNPGEIDFVVVREGTESAYTGNGGVIRVSTPHEVTSEASVNTHFGAEHVVRYAFELTMTRRKKLTLVHKANVPVHGGGVWQRTVGEVTKEYPGIDVDCSHVDTATTYLVTNPSRFDVIVTDNLFGDIITDETGAVSSGIGLAVSDSIDASDISPSMFKPVRGSAPNIVGKGIADPTATILSGAIMLHHLGRRQDAQRIEATVETNMVARGNGPIKTTGAGDCIAAALKQRMR